MRAQDCTRDIFRNRFSENARTPNCLHNICLYLYLRMYFRLCLHVDTSSFRLFKVARCTAEKHLIITKPHLATLNKRNELVSTCRHRRKYILKYK